MADITYKGVRVIGRKGIFVDGIPYVALEFYAHMGKQCYVFKDATDLGVVHIFLLTPGARNPPQYLCEAVNIDRKRINREEFAIRLKSKQRKICDNAFKL